ncbi:MAG: acyl carrier protein [Parcubacteria group bacterium]|nr:acyl carrier protein [Parcubacteria group bacterium]
MSTEERIKSIMADSLEVDRTLIKDNASIYTIAQWDSLQHLRLVMALQEEFGMRFGDREIPDLVSFAAIQEAITKKMKSHGKE